MKYYRNYVEYAKDRTANEAVTRLYISTIASAVLTLLTAFSGVYLCFYISTAGTIVTLGMTCLALSIFKMLYEESKNLLDNLDDLFFDDEAKVVEGEEKQ